MLGSCYILSFWVPAKLGRPDPRGWPGQNKRLPIDSRKAQVPGSLSNTTETTIIWPNSLVPQSWQRVLTVQMRQALETSGLKLESSHFHERLAQCWCASVISMHLHTWPPAGGNVWECHGTFGRGSLLGKACGFWGFIARLYFLSSLLLVWGWDGVCFLLPWQTVSSPGDCIPK